MYKFSNNNIITGQIKQLLNEFNLPKYPVLTAGKPILKDFYYIYNNYILKANTSGIFEEFSFDNFDIISSSYTYGDKILNVTKNLVLDTNIYNSYTHKYLGDYLRFYRDYNGVDLMSMYNCFSNDVVYTMKKTISKTINKISIVDGKKVVEKELVDVDFDSANDNYYIYMIPVKFFKKYTIAIDCDTKVELFSGLYDRTLLNLKYKDLYEFQYNNTYHSISSCRFKKPFIYDKLLDHYKLFEGQGTDIVKFFISQETNLKLFIKLPASCTTSITVLEGDYTKNCEIYFQDNHHDNLANLPVDNVIKYPINGNTTPVKNTYLSKLQLLNVNSNYSYPFSDRLVEYLFDNVINPKDEIQENIRALQYTLSNMQDFKSGNYYNFKGQYGLWDEELREYVYKIEKRYPINEPLIHYKFDLTGYIDKHIEQEIGDLYYGD